MGFSTETDECFCEDPDHELCWDGLFTQPDPSCECCTRTLLSIEDEGGA
jgi:hypothetical protein